MPLFPVRAKALTVPIDALQQEHALHRRVLTVFERMARFVSSGARFPGQDVARVLRYLREFVERAHHQKESTTLYPLALAGADESIAESVGQLIAEHDETLELLQSLWLFWEPGDLRDEERVVFTTIAHTYIARLRRHMDHEEQILFPMARALDDTEAASFAERFAAACVGLRGIDAWTATVADLEERWVA
ncbi:MAG: hemerythrin domain-containing protein [Planctomycetota bacterium]